MTNWTDYPFQLARTRQGEVILYADCDRWYDFRFGTLQHYLTADEFLRLHNSVLAFDPALLTTKPIQLDGETGPRISPTVMLFGNLTRADMLELKALLGRAALLVTSLSRAYNDVN